MKKITLLLFIIFITTSNISYSQEAAIYTSDTTGTLDGIPFTLSDFEIQSILSYDYTSADYAPAPLSDDQPSIDYLDVSNWTVTFDSPVSNLSLYLKFWRNLEVSFNHPFTIISGSNLSTPGDNDLNTVSFSDGIIEFNNPVTTLTLTVNTGTATGLQVMTFASNDQSLSTSEFTPKKDIKLFPNPSNDYIQILGLTGNEKYTLYNVLGVKIKNGNISNNEQIDIRDFTNGLYFLKFENGNTIKFIKE